MTEMLKDIRHDYNREGKSCIDKEAGLDIHDKEHACQNKKVSKQTR